MIIDGIENLNTGLGTAKDQRSHSDFGEVRLTKEEIIKAYRFDWVFPKAVDIPAKDMTRKWLLFSGDSTDIIKEQYKKLEVKKVVREALIDKALYGQSHIIIESESRSLKLPLRPTDKIKKFHLYNKYEFDGIENDVHQSRIYTMKQNKFGDSILYKIKDSILNLLTSLDIPASLLHKADVDFLSIKGLADALRRCKNDKNCKDAEEKILKRVQTMYEQISMFRIGVKDSEESFETFSKDTSGYDRLQMVYMQVVAGAADIPITRFFGVSPSGLNATGESEIKNYHESLSAIQDELIEPFLEIINEIILTSNQKPLDSFLFEFAPIRDLAPQELLGMEKDKASIISMFIDELDPETIAKAISKLSVFKDIEVVSSEKEE